MITDSGMDIVDISKGTITLGVSLDLEFIIGDEEVKTNILTIKDNKTKQEYKVKLEDVIDFLDEDYQSAIEGIFNALFSLLKNYDQNKSRVQFLIHLLEFSFREEPRLRQQKIFVW